MTIRPLVTMDDDGTLWAEVDGERWASTDHGETWVKS